MRYETELIAPPHNPEAERALIGCVLTRSKVYPELADLLLPSDFHIQRLRWIWESFARLTSQGLGIDLLTVSADLDARELLEETGQGFLTSLASNAPSPLNVGSYAAQIQEMSGKRQSLLVAGKIAEYSLNGKSVSEIVDYAQRELSKISGADSGSPFVDASALAGQMYDAMGRDDPPEVLPTGFLDLDKLLRGGLRPGRLMLVAGRPGDGKSALALGIAGNTAGTGARVAVFNMEMPNEEQANRMLAQLSGIPYDRIDTRKLADDDWAPFTQAVEQMMGMEIYFDDTPSLTIPDLRAKLRRLGELDLVIVDSLNLLNAQMPSAATHERINWLGYQLKILAREWGVTVLAAHHMNRGVEQTERDPQLSDLEQAGEKPADIVAFLFQRAKDAGTNVRHIKIAKHRGGPLGYVDLLFMAPLVKFVNQTTGRTDPND